MASTTRPFEMKLEVVIVPVSDVDRAKKFYESLGWRLDADFAGTDDFRVVQFTPPGSDCSIILGKEVTNTEPGSLEGLQLVVSDIDAARKDLLDHGVEVSEPFHDADGVFHHAGTDRRVAGPAPAHQTGKGPRASASAGGARARGAREADRQGRSGVARVVRGVHGARARRRRAAAVGLNRCL